MQFMSVCVPKHIICGSYIPDFEPGTTSCNIQSFTERRSRLTIGGSHFRSIYAGSLGDSVTVSCVWQYSIGGSPETWVNTTDYTQVERVEVTISDGITTEVYHAYQSYTFTSPQGWDVSAIPSLRSEINANSAIIYMPFEDRSWNASTDDADFLNLFPATNLSGGAAALPDSPLTHMPKIRTGPVYDIVHIRQSEIPNGAIADKGNDGSLHDIDELYFWDGNAWVSFNVETMECYDPNEITGSPLMYGSPPTLFCI